MSEGKTPPAALGENNVFSVVARVSAAIAAVGIPKSRTNVGQGWKYRGIDDVYSAIAPIMAREGLVVFANYRSRACEKREKVGYVVTLEGEFRFVSARDGSEFRVYTFGEGADFGDKATAKAMTFAHKTALVQTLMIPDVGTPDPEDDDGEDSQRSEPPKSVFPKESVHVDRIPPLAEWEGKTIPSHWLPEPLRALPPITYREGRTNPAIKFTNSAGRENSLRQYMAYCWANSTDQKQRAAYEALKAAYPSEEQGDGE